MTMYAVFDEVGLPTAFYDDEIHVAEGAIPEEAIQISNEQWQEFIDHPGQRRWTGLTIATIAPSVDLKMYAVMKLARVRNGGISVTLSEAEAAANVGTDEEAIRVLGVAIKAIAAGGRGDTSYFRLLDGSLVQMSNADVQRIDDVVSIHFQACLDAEASLLSDIDDDTVTTTAEIDSRVAAITTAY